MKLKTILRITKTACVLGGFASIALTSSVQAQTIFNGGGNLQVAGNWSNGLPSASNLGTISVNGTYATGGAGLMDGYFMTLTDGTLSRVSGSAVFNLANGSMTVDGDGAVFSYTGLSLGNSSFTINSGTATAATGTSARATAANNSTFTFNGGTSTFNREMTVSGTGQYIFNGGSVTIGAGANAAETGFKATDASPGVAFIFNGGTVVAPNFSLSNARTVQFGGTTAGSLTLTDTVSPLGSNITLNWLSGSLMTLTAGTSNQAFYENLWTTNVLQYNGANTGNFSDYFSVSGSTLSVIPEPSTYALLLGSLALAAFINRRRYKPSTN